MKIEWADPAVEDLVSIHDFIAKGSPSYAQQFAGKILEAVEKLAVFPDRGRWVSEAGRSDVRELIFQSYRIMYQVDVQAQKVFILAIVHGKRNVTAQSPKPWDI